MTLEEHQKEVDKLFALESQLIDLIADTGSLELMKKYDEWVDQRDVCNTGFNSFIEDLAKGD